MQQQNAMGVTFHSPIEIILFILWVSHIQYLQVHINLGALGLPVSDWHFVYTVVYIVIICASCQLCKIAPETSSWMFLVLQQNKVWKISFAFCLLQELPMRCSAINLVDSGDSPWGWLHGHNQTSCTFDSSHSRADTKWRLSVSYLTLSCLQNVKGLSLNPKLHQN